MRKLFYIKIIIGIQTLVLLNCSDLLGQKYNPNKEFRTTWKDWIYKGKVKQVTLKTYFNIQGDSLLKIWRTFTTDSIANAMFFTGTGVNTFNTNGILQSKTESRYFYKNHVISVFVNDDKGLPTANSNTPNQFLLDSIKQEVDYHTGTRNYIYSSTGKLAKIIQANNDTLNSFAADFKYDEQDRLIQTTFYENKNAATGQWNYTYDKKDSVVEVEFYNYWANQYSVQKFLYQKNGWQTKCYLNDNKLYRIEESSFDKDSCFLYENYPTKSNFNKRKTELKLDKDGISLYNKLYNEQGNLIQESTTIKKTVNKFGKFDEIVRNVKTPKGNRIDKVIYEYNETGDLIKETVFEDDKMIYQIICTYQYY